MTPQIASRENAACLGGFPRVGTKWKSDIHKDTGATGGRSNATEMLIINTMREEGKPFLFRELQKATGKQSSALSSCMTILHKKGVIRRTGQYTRAGHNYWELA